MMIISIFSGLGTWLLSSIVMHMSSLSSIFSDSTCRELFSLTLSMSCLVKHGNDGLMVRSQTSSCEIHG
jgi:hypothetical protein